MAVPGVLIFERGQRRWEAAIKRELCPEVWVRPCKTLADVREQLQARPGSVVVIMIDAGSETGAVVALSASSPHASAAIVIARTLSDEGEWLLREIGVDSVLYEPLPDAQLARQCRRMLPPNLEDPIEALLADDATMT